MENRFYPLASSTWGTKEFSAMQRVISSGNFTMGKEVKYFEQSFADFFGSKYAVMSNSGSSANLLAVAAMKYSKSFTLDGRNEVIVPAVSWSTTYYPLTQMGYKLKFVDINLDTLNIDTESALAAIDQKTAGIFTVNLLGNPSDLGKLREAAEKAQIFLLEDNCESMGAKLDGKQTGTFGSIGTYSSFFSHHISTMEGGMCVTDDLELAQVMTSMRAHGWTRELPDNNFVHNKTGNPFADSFRFVLPGFNLRPLELSGAIGIEQLKKLPDFVQARRENAKIFKTLSQDFDEVRVQNENGESSWFGFSLVLQGKLRGRRSEVVAALEDSGIDTRPIVAGNFTKNPVMLHLNHVPLAPLPNADEVHDNGLFVGNHHFDLQEQLQTLFKILKSI